METGLIFGIGAAALMIFGFVVYMTQVANGQVKPNGASWIMWAFGSTLTLLAEADLGLPRDVLACLVLAAIGAVLVLARSFLQSKDAPIAGGDYLILAFNLGISLWTLLLLAGPVGELGFDEATGLLFVALCATGAVTAAWPTLGAACVGAGTERPHAWFIWSAAYGLLALAVMAEGLGWHYLIYPVVAQAVHLLIGLFTVGHGGATAENRDASSFQLR